MQTVTQSFMTCTAGYMFLQSTFEFKFSLALLWLLSEISFVISGTRHEKLVSIDRFLFSFPILCDLVVILLYSADLCIWFQWIVVHVIKEVYSSAHLKFSLLPLSSSEHWVPTHSKWFESRRINSFVRVRVVLTRTVDIRDDIRDDSRRCLPLRLLNVSHRQQFFSEVPSPERSHKAN